MIDNPCEWGSATLLIFSENVGELVYYTHIFPLLISLFLGVFVLINAPHAASQSSPWRSWLSCSRSWVYFRFDSVGITERTDYTMFFWNAYCSIEILLYT